MQQKTEKMIKAIKMIKAVTRTLYIDGKLIEEYTQDPMADSELADIEQIAARMELLERQKKTQNSADVSNDAGEPRRSFRKRRPKTVQLKLKLLQAVSKMLLLGHKASVERHVVCLYVEHHVEPSAKEPSHTAQA